MLDEKNLNKLQNAMQRFCESDCREKSLDALREILDLIDFEDSPTSSQCLAEFNREFLTLVVKNELFINKLSVFLADTTGDFHVVLYLIYLITSICGGCFTDDTIGKSLFKCLMKNGIAELLLYIVNKLQNTYEFLLTTSVLSKFMIKEIHPDLTNEQFFRLQGKMFSSIPRILAKGSAVKPYRRTGTELRKVGDFAGTIVSFTTYINNTDPLYCRSMIRSHIQDGTVLNVTQLFVKICHTDPSFLDKQVCAMGQAIYKVYCADINTVFNAPTYEIDREIRVLVPTFIEHLSQRCSNKSCGVNICAILHSMKADQTNIDFLRDINFFKSVASVLIGEISSRCVSQERATLLWSLVCSSFDRFQDIVSVDDVMLLLPHFSELIALTAYNSPPEAEFSRTESLFLSATTTFFSDAIELVPLKEEHLIKLVDMDFIPMLIDVLTQTYRNPNNADLVISTIENIVFSFKSLLAKVPPTYCTKVIDQIMAASSIFMEFLRSERYHDLYHELPCEKIVQRTCQLLTDISLQFLRIQREHTCAISHQVSQFLGSELEMVDCIGKAIELSDDSNSLFKLFGLLTNLSELATDRKGLIKKMVGFLPHICEKCRVSGSDGFDCMNGENVCSNIEHLMEAAVAYSIDDVKPTVVSLAVAPNAFFTLKFKEVKPVRFNFDNLLKNQGVHSCGFKNSTPMKLRVIWNLSRKYPAITHRYFESSDVFKGCTCDHQYHISDEVSKVVINTAIFYLDEAEEHSDRFLRDLTEFVGDLSVELDSCKRLKDVFIDLLGACNRFLNKQSQKILVGNLTKFVDVMHYNWINFTL